MKKILVPTDFSKPSKVAVLYAAGLAKQLNAKVILLSVISLDTRDNALPKWKKMEEEMIKDAQQSGDQLINELGTKVSGVHISYYPATGFPISEVIERFAKDNGIDFIVMGTKGATGLKKILVGSNATDVINSSSVPVMIIPGETLFRPIKKIVYASNLMNLDEGLKVTIPFAKLFDASMKILHVVSDDSFVQSEKELIQQLLKSIKYPKIDFHVSVNDSVEEAVDGFVTEQNADLLTMLTHKLDFYEKLFGKSITRQLAFHQSIPMLTFNKSTYQGAQKISDENSTFKLKHQ